MLVNPLYLMLVNLLNNNNRKAQLSDILTSSSKWNYSIVGKSHYPGLKYSINIFLQRNSSLFAYISTTSFGTIMTSCNLYCVLNTSPFFSKTGPFGITSLAVHIVQNWNSKNKWGYSISGKLGSCFQIKGSSAEQEVHLKCVRQGFTRMCPGKPSSCMKSTAMWRLLGPPGTVLNTLFIEGHFYYIVE